MRMPLGQQSTVIFYAICAGFVILWISTLYLFILTIKHGRKMRVRIAILALLVFEGLFSAPLFAARILPGFEETIFQSLLKIKTFHWVSFLAICGFFEAFIHYRYHLHYMTHLSTMSFKDAFDALDCGVAFYKEDGTTVLVNPKISALSRQILGVELADGELFWHLLREKALHDFGHAVFVSDGKQTYRFQRSKIEPGLYELIGTDITEFYELNQKIDEENIQLAAMEQDLIAYGERMIEMIRKQEIVDARIRIHDQLGRLMLMSRRCLQEKSDPSFVLKQWKDTLALFQAAKKDDQSYSLGELEKAAQSIGVKLTIHGDLPEQKEHLQVLIVAGMECLLNTSRHAQGDEMLIEIKENEDDRIFEFTNTGKQPEEPGKEGGGLAYVRQRAREIGGAMEIEWLPRYLCRVILPKRRKA